VFVWLEDGMGNKDQQERGPRPRSGSTKPRPQGRFSNDGRTWTGWEAFSETKPDWDLSQFGGNANPGLKAVYAELRDRAGNVARLEARIEYIVAKPPTASFTVTPADPRPASP
jgi:hypothetical protein